MVTFRFIRKLVMCARNSFFGEGQAGGGEKTKMKKKLRKEKERKLEETWLSFAKLIIY